MSKKNGEKGFFETLKSSPKTMDEAKKKTKNLCIMVAVIFGVFVVLFSLLSIVVGLLWAVVAAGIIAYLYFVWTTQNKRNFCPACGTKYDYERCVAWQVSDVEIKEVNSNSNSSQGKQVIGKKMATVEFTCTCENCGDEREFTKRYEIATLYSDGTLKEYNIANMAKNYFKL